ncbi:ATP-dependent DNA helicase RecG [Flavicella marina]|uniref:ATP-dependent DNA helicase RecG n=1 Tax=Flavicella marina TaxID=1475951 RepID=UPI0012653266|nr:ATP-dependent DNA helicase RecG [Flavicella marina]
MSHKGSAIPVAYLKGVGPSRAELLVSELGIRRVDQLFSLFPIRYIDRSRFYKAMELQPNSSDIQMIGQITSLKTVKQKKRERLVARFEDTTGSIELVWFKGAKWIKENIKIGKPYVAFGKLNFYNGNFSMAHPELELLSLFESRNRSSIQAIYPSTEKLQARGVSNKVINSIIENLFREYYVKIQETLSNEILDKNNLLSKKEAMLNIHFPKSQELLTRAEYRLKFEELFFVQLQLLNKKVNEHQKIKGFKFDKIDNYFHEFYNNCLKFELTNAQKKVIKEIRKDLGSGIHMNRLLQGDVGSGKTIVAVISMLIALDNGFQATLIAPTEILANQHYIAIKELLGEIGVSVALLTGSVKTKERRIIHENLEKGDLHILVGTHAILEDKVRFSNLGLSIIDEQHRFGVEQRSKMWLKNTKPPHVLVMTATPIPRTLAMSLYGDLDISVIDELPPGRKEVKTVHRYDKNRLRVFKFMKDEIAKGRQVYVVYPLIEESEAMDYKDLMDGYESISREFPIPSYQISIVHGKMKPADKDYEMQRFIEGKTDIMVATTVIEVGVNVPNASIMVVESSERFGLSQLHQLRGRVGRGADQSFCILMSSFKLSAEAKTRIETMVQTTDGFEIAEVDLKLRGPGNLMGKQQSGVLYLKVADLVKDNHILSIARQEAIDLLKEDSDLSLTKHQNIKNTFDKITQKSNLWSHIS